MALYSSLYARLDPETERVRRELESRLEMSTRELIKTAINTLHREMLARPVSPHAVK